MPSHNEISCARKGCFAIITVHPDDEARLRRTHETFYCPAGHENYFPGKTPDQQEREKLERRVEMAERLRHQWMERYEDAIRGGELVATGARTCPLGCGWAASRRPRGLREGDEEAIDRYLDRAGRDLAEHLLADHNATRKPIALIPERSGASRDPQEPTT